MPLALAVLWGIADPFATMYPRILGAPMRMLIILAVGAIIVSLVKAWSPSKISLRWDALQLSVVIKAGDLFAEEDNIAVTSDDFFLTQSPKLVNPRSLIGQLVERCYNQQAVALDADIEQGLTRFSEVSLEQSGPEHKNKRYPIGTTPVIRRGNRYIFVTALCRVDLESNHGRATADDVWLALRGLWKTISQNPSGKAVAIPLIGTGQTGSGLSHSAVLNITLASLLTAARQSPIHDPIHIIVPTQSLAEIDLRSIHEAWINAGAA